MLWYAKRWRTLSTPTHGACAGLYVPWGETLNKKYEATDGQFDFSERNVNSTLIKMTMLQKQTCGTQDNKLACNLHGLCKPIGSLRFILSMPMC